MSSFLLCYYIYMTMVSEEVWRQELLTILQNPAIVNNGKKGWKVMLCSLELFYIPGT